MDCSPTIAPFAPGPRYDERPSKPQPDNRMTAVEHAAVQTPPRDTSPRPETKLDHPQLTAAQQDWGCHGAMPRLSEVVPGWKVGSEASHNNPVDEADGGGGGGSEGEGVVKDRTIPPHRRKVLRTRAAPAGPHPYLDRFASGMHRPLEGKKTCDF